MDKLIYEYDSGGFLTNVRLDLEPPFENETYIKPPEGLYIPKFNGQEWVEGNTEPIEPNKPPTPDEILAEKIEEAKHKTVTEFELRKLLAEQQKNNMQMMLMMLKK